MGAERPRQLTPITEHDAAQLLAGALHARGLWSVPVAELLLALVWVETAHGQRMHHHNWGNLMARPDGSHDYFRPAWFAPPDSSSALRPLHERMLRGEVPEAFRAYASHSQGLFDLLALLQTPRYAPLLAAARSGATEEFVRQLQQTGYAPGYSPRTHQGTFESLRAGFRRRALFQEAAPLQGQGAYPGTTPSPTTSTAAAAPPNAERAFQIVSLAIGAGGLLFGVVRWFDQRRRQRMQFTQATNR